MKVTQEGPKYAAFLNGLHLGEATLTFPQTQVLRYRVLEPPERQQPQVADDDARWFLSRLRNSLTALDGGTYAAGRSAAADVPVGYALLLVGKRGLDAEFTPEVAAYRAGLSAWPRYRTAQAAMMTQGVPPTDFGASAQRP